MIQTDLQSAPGAMTRNVNQFHFKKLESLSRANHVPPTRVFGWMTPRGNYVKKEVAWPASTKARVGSFTPRFISALRCEERERESGGEVD